MDNNGLNIEVTGDINIRATGNINIDGATVNINSGLAEEPTLINMGNEYKYFNNKDGSVKG
jgi:hypothetical protein